MSAAPQYTERMFPRTMQQAFPGYNQTRYVRAAPTKFIWRFLANPMVALWLGCAALLGTMYVFLGG